MTYKAFFKVFLVALCLMGFLESQRLPSWAGKDGSIRSRWNDIEGKRKTVFQGRELWERLDDLIKAMPEDNDPELLKRWRRRNLGSFDYWFAQKQESIMADFSRREERQLIIDIRNFIELMYISEGFRSFLKRHWENTKFLMGLGVGVGIVYYLREFSLVWKRSVEQDRAAMDRQHTDLYALKEAVLTNRASAERVVERRRRRRVAARRGPSGSRSGSRSRSGATPPSEADEAGEGQSGDCS